MGDGGELCSIKNPRGGLRGMVQPTGHSWVMSGIRQPKVHSWAMKGNSPVYRALMSDGLEWSRLVSPGIKLGGVVFPSQNNNSNILRLVAYCNPCGNWKFLAVRRVKFDDPSQVSCWPSISSHVIRWCVRTSAPPSLQYGHCRPI
jgi:hypothetical protein